VPPQLAYRLSIVFGFIAWGMICVYYVWPQLRVLPLPEALRPLLLLHSFRYLGLAFLIPGVVSSELPSSFARPAAYGDIVAAVLAVAAFAGLSTGAGITLVWVFNVWGSADLLYAFYNVFRLVRERKLLASHFGAAYFIPSFFVPLLLITHGTMFWLLLRS
jgi:hypothetical protein